MPWFIVILSYFFGSIPTSYIVGRFTAGRDIRRIGDENAGAANAYRELGTRAGIFVGVLDAAKGSAVILIAQAANMSQAIVLIAGVAAVVGPNEGKVIEALGFVVSRQDDNLLQLARDACDQIGHGHAAERCGGNEAIFLGGDSC